MIDGIKESLPNSPQQRENSYELKIGQWISNIVDNLWVRVWGLSFLENSSFIRTGNVFTLIVDENGEWVLTIMSNGKIKDKIKLPKEAIYQNVETDNSWLNIAYIRISNSNKYQIVYRDQSVNGKKPYFVDAKNLDIFRNRLNQESGKLITECSSRNEQRDLACSIKSNKTFPWIVDVNSTDLFDFLPKSIDLGKITQLLIDKEKTAPEEFWKFIASFVPQSASK